MADVLQRPQAFPRRLGFVLYPDRREPGGHECRCRVLRMGKKLRTRQRLFQCSGNLLSPPEREAPQRFQRFLRVDLAERQREHPGAQTCPQSTGFDGIHLP